MDPRPDPSGSPASGQSGHPEAAARPHVVVVGAGHGGLEIVRGLKREAVDVTLVDRHNYHTFQPLLYQVATAGLQPGDITQPVRHIVHDYPGTAFRMGTVTGADVAARTLTLDDADTLPYDVLVVAAGASTTFFGTPGAEAHAFPLKSVSDAVAIRAHVLEQFEAADRDAAKVEEGALTVAVVGGGATGVEMAGALAELFDHVLAEDYPALDVARAEVVIVEAGPDLLDAYDPQIRAYARKTLERRGVTFRFGAKVTRVEEGGVALSTGEWLPAKTTVWAAGVRANALADRLGLPQTRGGRVVVDEALHVPGHPEILVIGDVAGAHDAHGVLYPQVAQVAIQQGRHAAREVRRALRGLEPVPFVYRDPGQMATIGRNAAVLQTQGGRRMTGLLAWLAWLLIHVVYLVGFRNRVQVLLSWLYNYFTYDRGPRLIFTPESARAEAAAERAGIHVEVG
ncbi:MAG TPA: NAD(P)/FAD-dependent oxidoreductase [Rhodothermales bacterium]|nr:NAD(P)/FAD-dependent oxidoreductase [Rhodothermales bacterium]